MNVIELFAGVGGFRIGFNNSYPNYYHTIWANQWEPATRIQHAAMVYEARFGQGSIVNEDINTIPTDQIPNHDMLCGGFPCQDYSVATSLSNSKGIEGKKGVLWWSINRILTEKGENRPEVVFLENVDRLVLSPAKQRGRDFAIILECLNQLGYIVEWRIINAAEYGFPQRRRRTYIVAYKPNSQIFNGYQNPQEWMLQNGVFARSFPIVQPEVFQPREVVLSRLRNHENRLLDITNNFNVAERLEADNGEEKLKLITQKPFYNCGFMIDGVVYSINSIPDYHGVHRTIRDIMAVGNDEQFIAEDFYINDADLERWRYFKAAKHEPRVKANGFEYLYSEGAMDFPDSLDKPSRTIITSEGGKTPDRCKHVIQDLQGRYRRLVPLELERLNMFPDNHTMLEGVNDAKRAFLMGNALVTGVITKVADEIARRRPEQNNGDPQLQLNF